MEPSRGSGEQALPQHPESGTTATAAFPPPRSAPESGASTASPEGSRPPRSPWSVAALALTAVLLAGALLTHLAMVFLSLAPTNAVSSKHRERIDAYVQPEFGQDWRLFAPNPQQRNEAVGVRLRTAGENGTPALSGWVNLTAEDVETIRGNLAPSHAHQNMLRRAWDGYVNSHSLKDRPRRGPLGELSRTYLKRVVLQRIGREWQGRRIVGVQVAGRFTAVPPPSWHHEKASDTTEYRVLPWWPVTDQDYREL